MAAARFGLFALAVFLATTNEAFGLQCWKCSSDIERACSDRFNATDFYGGGGTGGSRYYDSYNQNSRPYQQQQRQYDPNYNPNYPNGQSYNNNPNFNQNYNPNFNPSRNSLPFLETCDDNDARLRRMRNVCMKQTLRSSSSGNPYQTVIRRCHMIPLEAYAGTCQQDVPARGLSLDFCEYCEYDGCNSANGIATNLLLAVSLAGAIFWTV